MKRVVVDRAKICRVIPINMDDHGYCPIGKIAMTLSKKGFNFKQDCYTYLKTKLNIEDGALCRVWSVNDSQHFPTNDKEKKIIEEVKTWGIELVYKGKYK